jgi:hypothetical protein
MAGEYQLAEKKLQEGFEEAKADDGMDDMTFLRAALYQLTELNKTVRTNKDIAHELNQQVMMLEDDGDPVISRGS